MIHDIRTVLATSEVSSPGLVLAPCVAFSSSHASSPPKPLLNSVRVRGQRASVELPKGLHPQVVDAVALLPGVLLADDPEAVLLEAVLAGVEGLLAGELFGLEDETVGAGAVDYLVDQLLLGGELAAFSDDVVPVLTDEMR